MRRREFITLLGGAGGGRVSTLNEGQSIEYEIESTREGVCGKAQGQVTDR